MEITPIASDSMGIRSFSVFVKTEDLKIIIDPGIDISPDRFSLPPHKLEFERFLYLKEKIKEFLLISDVIIVTHFHHDHFTKEFIPFFKNKFLILKDYKNVNYMQRERSKEITERIHEYEFGDGREFKIKNTKILFSNPLPHGYTPATVISVVVEEKGFKMLYSSDISGPIFNVHTDFIINMQPNFIILDGPPVYINKSLKKPFLENIFKILGICKKIIIDHHISREENFRTTLKEIEFETFATFNSLPEEPLEGLRKRLWAEC